MAPKNDVGGTKGKVTKLFSLTRGLTLPWPYAGSENTI